ncbi:MAG: hypothetical protein Q4A44_02705 [Bacteroidales bacterium]|nr:hypothetical protein [Bacteroidales bacterium]
MNGMFRWFFFILSVLLVLSSLAYLIDQLQTTRERIRKRQFTWKIALFELLAYAFALILLGKGASYLYGFFTDSLPPEYK